MDDRPEADANQDIINLEEPFLPDERSALYQPRVRGLPRGVRNEFGQKVYILIAFFAALGVGAALPFGLDEWFSYRFRSSPLAITLVLDLLIVVLLIHFLLSGMLGEGLQLNDWSFGKVYLQLMKTAPWNYIYCSMVALDIGCFHGATFLVTTPKSFILWIAMAIAMMFFLTFFSVLTGRDFSLHSETMGNVCKTLLLAGLFRGFVTYPWPVWVDHAYIGLWALLFAFMIILETQLILGSARHNQQKIEYTLDMYAYAAFNLFVLFALFLFCVVLAFATPMPRVFQGQFALG